MYENYAPNDQQSAADRYQSALLCAKNIGNIQGRVLLQSSARHAYDTDKVIAHARSYVCELEKAGIPRDRVCIKIPATGPALNASLVLFEEGIRTLGTSVFSVAQAIAASQAKCLSISPYINCQFAHETFPEHTYMRVLTCKC